MTFNISVRANNCCENCMKQCIKHFLVNTFTKETSPAAFTDKNFKVTSYCRMTPSHIFV